MLSRLQLPKSSIWSQWFPGEVGCCLTTARPSPVVRAALLATPELERDDRSTPISHGRRTTAAAAAPPDWKATSRRWPSIEGPEQEICRSTPPDLRLQGVGGSPDEGLHPQILL